MVEHCLQASKSTAWFLKIPSNLLSPTTVPRCTCSDLHFICHVGTFTRLVGHLVFPHGFPLLLWVHPCLFLLLFVPFPFPSQSNQLLLFSHLELLACLPPSSVLSLGSYFHSLLITWVTLGFGSSWVWRELAWENSMVDIWFVPLSLLLFFSVLCFPTGVLKGKKLHLPWLFSSLMLASRQCSSSDQSSRPELTCQMLMQLFILIIGLAVSTCWVIHRIWCIGPLWFIFIITTE